MGYSSPGCPTVSSPSPAHLNSRKTKNWPGTLCSASTRNSQVIPACGTNRGVQLSRLSIQEPIHLLQRLETASQQRRAKHEGLGLRSGSRISNLMGRNPSPEGFERHGQVALFLLWGSGGDRAAHIPALDTGPAGELPSPVGCCFSLDKCPFSLALHLSSAPTLSSREQAEFFKRVFWS